MSQAEADPVDPHMLSRRPRSTAILLQVRRESCDGSRGSLGEKRASGQLCVASALRTDLAIFREEIVAAVAATSRAMAASLVALQFVIVARPFLSMKARIQFL